jgi:hypothetical protein
MDLGPSWTISAGRSGASIHMLPILMLKEPNLANPQNTQSPRFVLFFERLWRLIIENLPPLRFATFEKVLLLEVNLMIYKVPIPVKVGPFEP